MEKESQMLNKSFGLKLQELRKGQKISKPEFAKYINVSLEDINEKLAVLIDYYNNNITSYNKLITMFPTNIVAKINKYKTKLFFDMKDMSDNDYNDFKL